MNCEIITIGDELLIGQVTDTNSAWMAGQLNAIGIRVIQKTTVQDDIPIILKTLDEARNRADLILITGGLGPTKDDMTKEALCRYFDSSLVEDRKVVADLSAFFLKRGKELTETNRRQAALPAKCIPIYNPRGTAPGMWFDDRGQVFVSLPGVPYEMMGMMSEFVIPRLKTSFSLPEVFHATLLTVGIGESYLSDQLSDWETALPPFIKPAYLPSLGSVRLRLSCYRSGPDEKARVEHELRRAAQIIGENVFAMGDVTPEAYIAQLLMDRGETLSVAESCTGGYLSHQITSVPGSSAYFLGSVVSYANKVKTDLLGVDSKVLDEKGAVSEAVAMAMAEGVRKKTSSTYGLSTTGIAGPSGGSAEKPVGTVWIGISTPRGTHAHRFHFGHNRLRNIRSASLFAIDLLRRTLFKPET